MKQDQHVPSVVILGGGTGTFVVAQALKNLPVHVTAVLTMVDDGGSNKILRDEFGLLPTSGIRQCIVALSENPTMLRELFTYRFHQGEGLNGMTFGNIFMAAMADIMGSQKAGIEETCKLLNVKGTILPISYCDARLVATYEDHSEVFGEHHIDDPKGEGHDGTLRIEHLRTEPACDISEETDQAIRNADLVILGPGDFYTNTVANLVVGGVVEALKNTKGKVCFISNLMAKYGETYGYSLKDFFTDLEKYMPLDQVDYVLINNNMNFPTNLLKLYEQEHDMPIQDNIKETDVHPGVQFIRRDLLSQRVPKKALGDVLNRSVVRHDPEKIAQTISELLMKDGFEM
ncbi:MAG: gluconeogenesis factor YvcK family protein [Patescibacteria group bacterium]